MQRVYSSPDPMTCGWLASVLEAAGIVCQLRNHYLGGAVGELPVNECWPEIWALDDTEVQRAKTLIKQALAATPGVAPDWRCRQCGEIVDGVFAQCWQCGALVVKEN